MKIKSVKATEVLDSRGNPTIRTKVTLDDGSEGWAIVPSGASTGKYEAVELRDGDKARFSGNGVLKAIGSVENEIAPAIVGMNAEDQGAIDEKMIALDGTENKSRMGANAILSVSLAVSRAAVVAEKKPLYEYLAKFNSNFDGSFSLPVPMMNVINGGRHADWATDIQEFMILPVSAKTEREAIRAGVEVYKSLKDLLKTKGYSILVGDEGGFAPAVNSNSEPFDLLSEAIEKAGYKIGEDIVFGIDAAASEFFSDGKYNLKKEGRTMTSKELMSFYGELKNKYPIRSFEDVFAEDDWSAFNAFTAAFGNDVQVVGDDLFVTNIKKLEKGIAEKAANSILVKLNQIGTLTETVRA
ncbi:MAG: phosphopyruvate hydratase, partial [Candidatus Colwellbacteria bacterium]|nr:phosphopyruvate hydratase [Candidatus Colwellbacteria bacterium]